MPSDDIIRLRGQNYEPLLRKSTRSSESWIRGIRLRLEQRSTSPNACRPS